jgi:hypothetical protein
MMRGRCAGKSASFVIDRKGILRYAESGGFTAESIDEVLGPLLAEKAD